MPTRRVSSGVRAEQRFGVPGAPDWFLKALAMGPAHGSVAVRGCAIQHYRWGDTGRIGVVLVHGANANAHWWDHLAPLLVTENDVLALDLSGHGDSDFRSAYTLETWATEIAGVVADFSDSAPPVLVGHSLGGWVALQSAADYPELCGAVVVLDTPLWRRTVDDEAAQKGITFKRRIYRDRDTALSRFRTVPDQPTSLPYVIDHVARASLGRAAGGWHWKFDPGTLPKEPPTHEVLGRIHCPVALVRSEFGLVTPALVEHMHERLARRVTVVEVPLARHHAMLDQPIALASVLRTMLAIWCHPPK